MKDQKIIDQEDQIMDFSSIFSKKKIEMNIFA